MECIGSCISINFLLSLNLINKPGMYDTYLTTNPGKTVLYTGMTNDLAQRMLEHDLQKGFLLLVILNVVKDLFDVYFNELSVIIKPDRQT